MGHKEHKHYAGVGGVKCGVLTLSDSRTLEDDVSGRVIKKFLEDNDHQVKFYDILKEDRKKLEKTLEKLIHDPDIEVIITNGGTGVSDRDMTLDVVSKFIRKELVGFGELFRFLSYQEIGSSAIMSRAVAGVCCVSKVMIALPGSTNAAMICGNKIIISLPGSEDAVTLAMSQIIIPEIEHMVWEANR